MSYFFLILILLLTGSLREEVPMDNSANAWKSLIAPEVAGCLEQFISGSSFEAEIIWIPEKLARTPLNQDFRILCQQNEHIPSGLQQFELVFEKQLSERYPLQARISARLLLPVPKETIARGETITETDLVKKWVDIVSTSKPYLMTPEDITGNVARRNLQAMMPIASNYVHTKYTVNIGDRIELIHSQNGIEIAIAVKARQNGAPGDTIRLQAEQTRRLYLGSLTADGKAIWVRTL